MRCAYCHDDLSLIHHRCPGCGTLLHLDCASALAACPTLGCQLTHARVSAGSGGASTKRKVLWVLLAIVGPLLAFVLDAGMKIDPLIWGKPHLPDKLSFLGGPKPLPFVQIGLVWGATCLSFLGLLLFLLGRVRASFPFLLVGVVTSGAHALAFVPLIPLSVIGIVFLGLGLLGLLPYATFWVFLDLARRAREQLAEDEDWARNLFVDESKRFWRRLILIGASFAIVGLAVASPRPHRLYSPAAPQLRYVNLALLRADAARAISRSEAGLPIQTRSELGKLARYARVTIGHGFVRLDWPNPTAERDPDWPAQNPYSTSKPHWIYVLTEGQELPPAANGTRSVEFAPGVWSQWDHFEGMNPDQPPEFQHLPPW